MRFTFDKFVQGCRWNIYRTTFGFLLCLSKYISTGYRITYGPEDHRRILAHVTDYEQHGRRRLAHFAALKVKVASSRFVCVWNCVLYNMVSNVSWHAKHIGVDTISHCLQSVWIKNMTVGLHPSNIGNVAKMTMPSKCCSKSVTCAKNGRILPSGQRYMYISIGMNIFSEATCALLSHSQMVTSYVIWTITATTQAPVHTGPNQELITAWRLKIWAFLIRYPSP